MIYDSEMKIINRRTYLFFNIKFDISISSVKIWEILIALIINVNAIRIYIFMVVGLTMQKRGTYSSFLLCL